MLKKLAGLLLALAFPLICFAQEEVKLDDETKKVCNQVTKQIYEDILRIKNKYKELENFDESALMFDKNSRLPPHIFQVKNVVDGDMLILNNNEQVRLIGIDCPENEYSSAEALYLNQGKKWERVPESYEQAKRAREFTEKLVKDREVCLEFDVERRDKSGRLLAYVWYEIVPYSHIAKVILPENVVTNSGIKVIKNKQGYGGTFIFLNATIIKAGYAEPLKLSPNLKYTEFFQELYEEARDNKRGLWKE